MKEVKEYNPRNFISNERIRQGIEIMAQIQKDFEELARMELQEVLESNKKE